MSARQIQYALGLIVFLLSSASDLPPQTVSNMPSKGQDKLDVQARQFRPGKYSGPPLEASQVVQLVPCLRGDLLSVLLRNFRIAWVSKIDGKDLSQSASVMRWRVLGSIEIVPGRHIVEIALNPLLIGPLSRVRVSPIRLTLIARPGATYFIDAGTEIQADVLNRGDGDWYASIRDLATGETVAGVPSNGYISKASFSDQEYAPFKQPGGSVVSGTVQPGTTTEHSANYVLLVPATALTAELIEMGYLHDERIISLDRLDIPVWVSGQTPDSRFMKFAQKPVAFTFKGIPQGNYFVINPVVSTEQGKPVRGVAWARVTVGRNQQSSDVVCVRAPDCCK